MHRRYVPHRVMGPAPEEAVQASNAVGDVGNVVEMVLDFPTDAACRVSAQRGREWPHVVSVKRLAHGDEPDVGMGPHKDGQELLTDVHGTHVHEADPWGSDAIRGS